MVEYADVDRANNSEVFGRTEHLIQYNTVGYGIIFSRGTQWLWFALGFNTAETPDPSETIQEKIDATGVYDHCVIMG